MFVNIYNIISVLMVFAACSISESQDTGEDFPIGPIEYVTEQYVTGLEGKKLESKVKGLKEELESVSRATGQLETQVEAHGQFLLELHEAKVDKADLGFDGQLKKIVAKLGQLSSGLDSLRDEKNMREESDDCETEKTELEREMVDRCSQRLEDACAPVCVTILAAVAESGDPQWCNQMEKMAVTHGVSDLMEPCLSGMFLLLVGLVAMVFLVALLIGVWICLDSRRRQSDLSRQGLETRLASRVSPSYEYFPSGRPELNEDYGVPQDSVGSEGISRRSSGPSGQRNSRGVIEEAVLRAAEEPGYSRVGRATPPYECLSATRAEAIEAFRRPSSASAVNGRVRRVPEVLELHRRSSGPTMGRIPTPP